MRRLLFIERGPDSRYVELKDALADRATVRFGDHRVMYRDFPVVERMIRETPHLRGWVASTRRLGR